MEEAFAELPGTRVFRKEAIDELPAMAERVAKLEEEHRRLREVRRDQSVPDPAVFEVIQEEAVAPVQEVLFVKGRGAGCTRLHVKATSSALTPSWAWTTVCGWQFTSHDQGFSLLRPCDLRV